MMKNHSTPSTLPSCQRAHRFSLRHLRIKASLGIAAAVTTLLVACGGGGSEPETPPVSSVSPSLQPTMPPTSVIKVASKLNDTGITQCATADGSSNKADCSTAVSNATGKQVPLGQDGHYGTGMVFEKVAGFEGKCVQDKHTGLMWEVKQTDGGLHDASHTYSWYSTTNNAGHAGKPNGGTCKGSNCDTAAFVVAVNAASWCGHSDWRLPTREELRSIVDYSRTSPAIDTNYFPHTKYASGDSYGRYWSSSPSALSLSSAWGVYFHGGYDYYYVKYDSYYVRLVRGGQ